MSRELYSVNDPATPASFGARRTRRVLSIPASGDNVTRITVHRDAEPRTPEYHAGYAAGRRSVDRAAWCLIAFAAGATLAALIILVGSSLMAGA